MYGFLDAAERVLRTYERAIDAQAFRRILDLVYTKFTALHANTKQDLTNIETVFGIVEMGKLIRRLPGHPTSEIDVTETAMRTVLAQTVEFTTGEYIDDGNPAGTTGSYARLVELLAGRSYRQLKTADEVAFISFNYDIALDLALWAHDINFTYGLDSVGGDAVRVLKLHGSLNWGAYNDGGVRVTPYSYLSGSHLALPSRGTGRPAYMVRPVHATGRYAAHQSESEYQGIALVPPSWNKTQYHNTFRAIWEMAATELASARQLVIIGYSAQGTDGFFRDLLTIGLATNANLRRIVVVDKAGETQARFRELLGPQLQSRLQIEQQTFESWITQVDSDAAQAIGLANP